MWVLKNPDPRIATGDSAFEEHLPLSTRKGLLRFKIQMNGPLSWSYFSQFLKSMVTFYYAYFYSASVLYLFCIYSTSRLHLICIFPEFVLRLSGICLLYVFYPSENCSAFILHLYIYNNPIFWISHFPYISSK